MSPVSTLVLSRSVDVGVCTRVQSFLYTIGKRVSMLFYCLATYLQEVPWRYWVFHHLTKNMATLRFPGSSMTKYWCRETSNRNMSGVSLRSPGVWWRYCMGVACWRFPDVITHEYGLTTELCFYGPSYTTTVCLLTPMCNPCPCIAPARRCISAKRGC